MNHAQTSLVSRKAYRMTDDKGFVRTLTDEEAMDFPVAGMVAEDITRECETRIVDVPGVEVTDRKGFRRLMAPGSYPRLRLEGCHLRDIHIKMKIDYDKGASEEDIAAQAQRSALGIYDANSESAVFIKEVPAVKLYHHDGTYVILNEADVPESTLTSGRIEHTTAKAYIKLTRAFNVMSLSGETRTVSPSQIAEMDVENLIIEDVIQEVPATKDEFVQSMSRRYEDEETLITKLDETDYNVPVYATRGALRRQPRHVKPFNYKRLIVTLSVVCALLIGVWKAASYTYALLTRRTIDLTENIVLTYDGMDGAGKVTGMTNGIQYDTSDTYMNTFIEDLDYVYSKKSKLKNGDEITVDVTYDAQQAKILNLKIVNARKTFTVEGLTTLFMSASDVPSDTLSSLRDASASYANTQGASMVDNDLSVTLLSDYLAVNTTSTATADNKYLAYYLVTGTTTQTNYSSWNNWFSFFQSDDTETTTTTEKSYVLCVAISNVAPDQAVSSLSYEVNDITGSSDNAGNDSDNLIQTSLSSYSAAYDSVTDFK